VQQEAAHGTGELDTLAALQPLEHERAERSASSRRTWKRRCSPSHGQLASDSSRAGTPLNRTDTRWPARNCSVWVRGVRTLNWTTAGWSISTYDTFASTRCAGTSAAVS